MTRDEISAKLRHWYVNWPNYPRPCANDAMFAQKALCDLLSHLLGAGNKWKL
jgi:hypothetical protein